MLILPNSIEMCGSHDLFSWIRGSKGHFIGALAIGC